jgi:hypothetical protein
LQDYQFIISTDLNRNL